MRYGEGGGYTSVANLPRDLAGMEELGRLDALKMHCPSGRVGSNPTPGTSRGVNRVVPSPSKSGARPPEFLEGDKA